MGSLWKNKWQAEFSGGILGVTMDIVLFMWIYLSMNQGVSPDMPILLQQSSPIRRGRCDRRSHMDMIMHMCYGARMVCCTNMLLQYSALCSAGMQFSACPGSSSGYRDEFQSPRNRQNGRDWSWNSPKSYYTRSKYNYNGPSFRGYPHRYGYGWVSLLEIEDQADGFSRSSFLGVLSCDISCSECFKPWNASWLLWSWCVVTVLIAAGA